MAAGVPPPPINSPAGSYYWIEWYTSLTNFLNGTNIPWSNLNFTGSNLTDIQTRHHNDLQNIQGGVTTNRWHLVGAGYVDTAAAGPILPTVPTSWTAAHSGTGTYTITHNLNTASLQIAATAVGNAAFVQWIDISGLNSFVVHLVNTSNAPADGPFTFVCTIL